jgi:predicted enzyme related to lactoylglutathione lyase
MDMGGGQTYYMFKKGEQVVAGMMQITDEMTDVKSHWMSYVNVEDIDASVNQADELGGKVLFGPVQVAEMGKLAAIMDSTGAVFSFWQNLDGECEAEG